MVLDSRKAKPSWKGKSLSMVADVIINEGGNKIVRVIVTGLQSQEEWNINIPACLFKLVGQQLVMQEFVIFPLHKFGSKH